MLPIPRRRPRPLQDGVARGTGMGENGRWRRVEDTWSIPSRRRWHYADRPAWPAPITTASYTCPVVQQRTGTGCAAPNRPGWQRRRSAAERGLFVQPGELVRVADRVDAGDPAVRDHQADRRVELAGEIDPAGGRAVQPRSADHRTRRNRPEAGEEGRHPIAAHLRT